MKKAMLATVGVGATVADGIGFAIRQARPDFVLFLVTEESRDKTVPEAVAKAGLEKGAYACRPTPDANDVESCALAYSRAIQEVVRKGYAPEQIAADFTSGTKAMSAGLVAAGLEAGVGMLSYIYGERGEGGRVISGTERPMSLEPNRLAARREIRQAVDLFNAFRYDMCLEVVARAAGRTALPEVQQSARLLKGLAEAYRAWDRFDYKTAMARLDGLSGDPLVSKWGLKRPVERHKALLYRLKAGPYGRERAVDLWNSADRRAVEGRFDDAVARFYRLLEYIAQVRLYEGHGGIETGDVDVSKLPEPLQAAWEGRRGRSGRVEIGLVEAYKLLQDLEDPVGARFMEDFKDRKETMAVLGVRNRSILAHGFGPVGPRGYSRVSFLVRRYMDEAFGGWDQMAKAAAFPRLDPQVVCE